MRVALKNMYINYTRPVLETNILGEGISWYRLPPYMTGKVKDKAD